MANTALARGSFESVPDDAIAGAFHDAGSDRQPARPAEVVAHPAVGADAGRDSFGPVAVRLQVGDDLGNLSGVQLLLDPVPCKPSVRPGPTSRSYQYDTLNSEFRPLVACCRMAESSAEPDNPRIRVRSAGFRRSNRQPLIGILKFWIAWTIFVPQMQLNQTIKAHGMITELTVGN